MLIAALRDLQWRRRRFAIAIAGCALVFGLTLLVTGVANAFDAEATASVRDLGSDAWIVREGASGPFLGAAPLNVAELDAVRALPGVEDAAATSFTRKSVKTPAGRLIDVNIFAGMPGHVGLPTATEGRGPEGSGEAMISTLLGGYDIGDTITIAGLPLTVVGEIERSTAFAGTPNVFMTLTDAQKISFAGQPIATAIAIKGTPDQVPAGFSLVDRAAARNDLVRAIAKAKSTLRLVSVLLWIVAASIIGAVVYLSALERQRDFAVFKATGVSTTAILGGMVLQAAVLSIVAALLGSVIGSLLGPQFPMIVSIDLRAQLFLPVLALAIGMVASIAGLRRVVAVDPALAFGGP